MFSQDFSQVLMHEIIALLDPKSKLDSEECICMPLCPKNILGGHDQKKRYRGTGRI